MIIKDAPCGLIYDTKGRLLAENQPSYTLTIIRERVKNIEETLKAVGEILPLSDNEREKFQQRLRHRRPFDAGILLQSGFTDDMHAAIKGSIKYSKFLVINAPDITNGMGKQTIVGAS
jgi:cell division protein FtsI/penicillin-binding protein 2